jgi:hypothetical protein
VAYFAVGKGPTEIRHLDQQRTILVSAQLFQRSLGETFEELNRLLAGMKVPPGYTAALTGENRQMQESFRSLMFALILSVLLVYMVMAAELESLWQPFLIMATIPMSLIGVALGLSLTQTPISVMSGLGLIILGGVLALSYWRMPRGLAVVVVLAVLVQEVLVAKRVSMLGYDDYEQIWPNTVQWAEKQLPRNALVISGIYGGAFYYYAHRPTVRWELMTPDDFVRKFHGKWTVLSKYRDVTLWRLDD